MHTLSNPYATKEFPLLSKKMSARALSAGTALALLLGSMSLNAQVTTPDSEMVFIPGGEFEMGCDPETDEICVGVPEEKQHLVAVSPFYMDKFEVTTRRYRVCVEREECELPVMGGLMHFDDADADRFPINGVNWHQASHFCAWEGKRLPTSAEWEFAARGNDNRTYPWGNEAPDCEHAAMDRPNAGYLGCGTGNSLNVGSLPKGASPFGVMDMAGNVWEWVSDWYDTTYYDNSPYQDPQGPASGVLKITRGGDFLSRQGYELRATGRFPYYPGNPSPAIGFRCVKDVE